MLIQGAAALAPAARALPVLPAIMPTLKAPGPALETTSCRPVSGSSCASKIEGALIDGSRARGRAVRRNAKRGKVYAVIDKNGDQKADEVITVARGLNMPNGVAYRDGALYVAEVSRILRFDDIAGRLYNPPKPVIVSKAFP